MRVLARTISNFELMALLLLLQIIGPLVIPECGSCSGILMGFQYKVGLLMERVIAIGVVENLDRVVLLEQGYVLSCLNNLLDRKSVV